MAGTTNTTLDGFGNERLTGSCLLLVEAGPQLPEVKHPRQHQTGIGATETVDPAVTPVNDPPTLTVTTTNDFTEDAGASVGDVVAIYTTNDEETPGAVTVTLSDTTNYALDGLGNVTLTGTGPVSYKPLTLLTMFRVSPNVGAVAVAAANVDPAVAPVNDPPTLPVTTTNAVT